MESLDAFLEAYRTLANAETELDDRDAERDDWDWKYRKVTMDLEERVFSLRFETRVAYIAMMRQREAKTCTE